MCLSLEEVASHVGRKVLMDIDSKCALNVGDPQGILDQQLRPQPIEQRILDTNAGQLLS